MKVQANPAKEEATKDRRAPIFDTTVEKVTGAYFALMGLIALLIPGDILQAHAWAVTFSDFMASWVPQIDRITALGILPDLNRFYFSVLWAMSPVLFVLVCLMAWEGRGRTYPFWSLPLHKALFLGLISVVIVIVLISMVWITNPSNGILRFVLGNRLALGYFGNITFVVGPVGLTACMLVLILGWLSGAIPRHIQQQSQRGGE